MFTLLINLSAFTLETKTTKGKNIYDGCVSPCDFAVRHEAAVVAAHDEASPADVAWPPHVSRDRFSTSAVPCFLTRASLAAAAACSSPVYAPQSGGSEESISYQNNDWQPTQGPVVSVNTPAIHSNLFSLRSSSPPTQTARQRSGGVGTAFTQHHPPTQPSDIKQLSIIIAHHTDRDCTSRQATRAGCSQDEKRVKPDNRIAVCCRRWSSHHNGGCSAGESGERKLQNYSPPTASVNARKQLVPTTTPQPLYLFHPYHQNSSSPIPSPGEITMAKLKRMNKDEKVGESERLPGL
ncbi:hypothetical protein C0Q70_12734 [Pomacea canaliculata]|uniref:Uncharacterized protein n=1 Tax=Pomacea canaliculata TaxID=400727 RepID=A0A2T7P2C1_POMCA|nr:hypothetical protein C0Q70_12734 [Pomacea canaliculata]